MGAVAPEELNLIEQRTWERILGGVTESAGSVYREEELAREQKRTKELSEALAKQKRLSAWLRRAFLAIAFLLLLALAAAASAERSEGSPRISDAGPSK